ncbi:BolA/IbaG family iron-sulfur metabolism protein [Gammaproteobacteria bacterium]|jgi:acid stress-induced BolA-like protein IbaG/YrbA|nr:BolA/IbaG family iron-sulfur metabolism protein [Gammaproteobacteria bacterium]
MDIMQLLKSQFPDAEITFDGEDCNSKVLIVSKQFEGLSTLNRHKLIMSSLKEHFQSGELHALSLVTKSPEEINK